MKSTKPPESQPGRNSSLRRAKTEMESTYVLDLEKDLGKIDKDKLKPSEALKTVEEKWGKAKNIRNEHAESIIWVDEETGKATVAYKASFDGDGEGGLVEPVLITDTHGNTLLEYDNIQHASIVEKGTGRGGNSKIGCYDFGACSKAFLKVKDLGTGRCQYDIGTVKVVDLKNSWNDSSTTPFEYDCYHQVSDAINGGCSPLNDALYFGSKIYDMYKFWYGTGPLGTEPLLLKVHYGINVENAGWDETAMYFGDGYETFYPLVSLDVTAHEIAHGVTNRNSDLFYSDQSGGLNEAYSDMAGKTAERYARGYNSSTFKWGVGYNIFKDPTGSLRCMDNPPCDGDSIDHVSKYYTGMNVHFSSGIFNKVFYHLSSKFDNDLWDAHDLFYIANTKFWGPNTNFVDAAELTLKAMDEMKEGKHLYYSYDWINIQDVVDAFTEVGISCSKSGTEWNCTS